MKAASVAQGVDGLPARGSFARLRPWLTAAYLVAVLVAAYAVSRGHLSDISARIDAVPITHIAAAGAFSLSGLVTSMLAWRTLLTGMGHELSLPGASHVYFLSQLGKYLPGSVWPAAMQAEAGRSYGISRGTNVSSYVLAMLLSLATALAVAGVTLGVSSSAQWFLVTLLAVPAIGGFIVASSAWPRVVRAAIPTRFASSIAETLPSRLALVAATLLFAASWVLHGLQLAVLASAAGVEGELLLLVAIGATCMASVGGLVVIIAPAGLAVRETLMAGLLGTGSLAAVAATVVLSRLVLTGADLLTGAAGAAIGAERWRRRRRSAPAAGGLPPGGSGPAGVGIHDDASVA